MHLFNLIYWDYCLELSCKLNQVLLSPIALKHKTEQWPIFLLYGYTYSIQYLEQQWNLHITVSNYYTCRTVIKQIYSAQILLNDEKVSEMLS